MASHLAAPLRNFGSRVHTNDIAVMRTIAEKMTEAEIRAVAEYLSGLGQKRGSPAAAGLLTGAARDQPSESCQTFTAQAQA